MLVPLLICVVAFVIAIAGYNLRRGAKTLVARAKAASKAVSKSASNASKAVTAVTGTGAKPAAEFGRYFRRAAAPLR